MSLTTFFNFLDTLVKDTRRIKDNRIIMFIICLLYLIFHLVTRHSHTAWTRAPGTVGTPGTPGVPLHSPRVHTCLGQTWNAMHSRFLMRSLSLHLSKSIVFMFWIHTGVIFSFVLFSPCYMQCFLFRDTLRIPQPDVRLDAWGRVLLAARLARRFRDGPESIRTGKLQRPFAHAKRFATQKYKLTITGKLQILSLPIRSISLVLFTEHFLLKYWGFVTLNRNHVMQNTSSLALCMSAAW